MVLRYVAKSGQGRRYPRGFGHRVLAAALGCLLVTTSWGVVAFSESAVGQAAVGNGAVLTTQDSLTLLRKSAANLPSQSVYWKQLFLWLGLAGVSGLGIVFIVVSKSKK